MRKPWRFLVSVHATRATAVALCPHNLPERGIRPMLQPMPPLSMPPRATERHAALFRNGRNQAVRIPRELELEGTEVLIRKEGDSLVLTPVRKHKLRDLLASWTPMDDLLPEVEDLPPQPRDPL